MNDITQLGLPGFNNIHYRGKPVSRKGFTGKMRVIVMQKRHPDMLDMRFKTNREFVAQQKKWRDDNPQTDSQKAFEREFMNAWPNESK